MILSKRNIPYWTIVLLSTLIISSCKKFTGDVTIPAYLQLDAITVVPQQQGAPSIEAGFYTSNVDCVQLICHFEGDASETVLGTFQLPCTLPVLRHGDMEYLTVIPCVKQNGIASTRIEYPYFQRLKLNDVHLTPDSITHIGTLDTTSGLWTLQTHYYSLDRIDILTEDYFEPTAFATHFDTTLTWIKNDPGNACTGQGYGLVHLDDTMQTRRFYIPEEYTVEKTKFLYLEMDYWTDHMLEVYITGYVTASSNASTLPVMKLYANNGWQKIYINLGKTWSQLNNNNPISISFQALNTEGISGDVRIDNIKIITI